MFDTRGRTRDVEMSTLHMTGSCRLLKIHSRYEVNIVIQFHSKYAVQFFSAFGFVQFEFFSARRRVSCLMRAVCCMTDVVSPNRNKGLFESVTV